MRIDLKGKIICCKGVVIISLAASLCFVFGHDTLRFQCFFSPRCINGKNSCWRGHLVREQTFYHITPGQLLLLWFLFSTCMYCNSFVSMWTGCSRTSRKGCHYTFSRGLTCEGKWLKFFNSRIWICRSPDCWNAAKVTSKIYIIFIPVGVAEKFQFSARGQWVCLHTDADLGVDSLLGNSIHISFS